MSFIEQVASKYVLASVHSEEVDGILTQRVDKKTGTKKWALVGRKPPSVSCLVFDAALGVTIC